MASDLVLYAVARVSALLAYVEVVAVSMTKETSLYRIVNRATFLVATIIILIGSRI